MLSLHGERKLTREAIAYWLSLNSGDFQGVDDFYASIGDQEFPWENEESECEYNDCMHGMSSSHGQAAMWPSIHTRRQARHLSNNDTRIEIERAAGELLKLAS